MRVPAVPALFILLLTATVLPAQDLQYRMRSSMSTPQQTAPQQAFESAMYIKGTSIRADNRATGFSNSVIVDAAGGKLYVVNHTERTFQEIPTDFAADSTLLSGDTARLRAMGAVPEVTRTGEKRTILGYEAVRIISVQKQPFPGDTAARTVMISDSWISQDPVLMKAFLASMTAAQKLMGGAAQSVMALMPQEAQGLPLATTTVIVKRGAREPVNARALLEQGTPAGWLMRSVLEATAIKLVELPDSLFRVPAGYQKTN